MFSLRCIRLILWSALLFGCAPVSEVMQEELTKSQYVDAIDRGESWLADATLENQSSEEGRKIHRLVAEARLGLAKARMRLKDFQNFRTRYEKFSAYEDLLSRAYIMEAQLAFDRLGSNPDWTAFQAFESKYQQSELLQSARRLIVGAEIRRAKAINTVAAFQAARARFLTWSEAKSDLADLMPLEAEAFRLAHLVEGASLEKYREYATTYSTQVNDPEVIETIVKLELLDAKSVDEEKTWIALRDRYDGQWAEPLKLEAKVGLLGVELDRAKRSNTRLAFTTIRARYQKEHVRLQELVDATECRWVLNNLAAQAEMRQLMRAEDALHFILNLLGRNTCKTAILDAMPRIRLAAENGDVWANRILRKFVRGDAALQTPMSIEQEAMVAWTNAKNTRRAAPLIDLLAWYPDAPFLESVDKRLVELTKKVRLERDRIQPKVLYTSPLKWRRFHAVVSLEDRFIGTVGLSKRKWAEVTLSTPSSSASSDTTLKLHKVRATKASQFWFFGAVKKVASRTMLRDALRVLRIQFALFGRVLSIGTVQSRQKRIKWRSNQKTDRIIDALADPDTSSTMLADTVAAIRKQRAQKHPGSYLFRVFDGASPAEKLQVPVCDDKTNGPNHCTNGHAVTPHKPVEMSSFCQGLGIGEQETIQQWMQRYSEVGCEVTTIKEMNRLGESLARAVRLELKISKGRTAVPFVPKILPQYVWFWHPPKVLEEQVADKIPGEASTNNGPKQGINPDKQDANLIASRSSKEQAMQAKVESMDGNSKKLKDGVVAAGIEGTPSTGQANANAVFNVADKAPGDEVPCAVFNRLTADGSMRQLRLLNKADGWDIYSKVGDDDWLNLGSLPFAKSEGLIHLGCTSFEGRIAVSALTLSQHRWLRFFDADEWIRDEISSENALGRAKVFMLNHRPNVLLQPNSKGGMMRSINGGKDWRFVKTVPGQYDQVGMYVDGSSMICARYASDDEKHNGVACSEDDGRSWVVYFKSKARIDLKNSNGALVISVDSRELSLGRLVDSASIRAAYLFVGKKPQVSQTGKRLSARLSEKLQHVQDTLRVSRSLDDGTTLDMNYHEIGSTLYETWRPTQPPKGTWSYAIIGRVGEIQPKRSVQ